MTGKPQYDEPTVIDAALDVFWRHGYAAASINQLTEATGLSRSSLYQRFQDKDGLFQEALSNYTARVVRRMEAVQADTMRDRLKALLRDFLPKQRNSKRPPGCMLARCCAEMPDMSEAGQAVALEGLERQRGVFEGLLAEAAASGELPKDADINGLAWYYLGVLQAIMNLPQAGAAPAALDRTIEIAMSAWPVAQAPTPNGAVLHGAGQRSAS